MADSTNAESFEELDNAVIYNPQAVLAISENLSSPVLEQNSAYYSQLHLKIASYLKARENSGTPNKESDLANTVLAKCQALQKSAEPPLKDETPTVCHIQTDISIQKNIRKCMNQLKMILSGELQRSFITGLESDITDFVKSPLTSLNEYMTLHSEGLRIRVGLNSLQTQIKGDVENTVSVTENLLFLVCMNLCYDLMCVQYQRKVDFVDFVLFNKSELRLLLFSHIPLTEERIQSHSKKLLLLFHPNHCELEQKAAFTEFFHLVIDEMNDQLRMLARERENPANLFEQYKAKGKEQWDIAVEYQCARKRDLRSLKRLNLATLKNLTGRELQKHQQYYAISAYESYRAAAREFQVAAGKEHAGDQIELQKSMALSLHVAGDDLKLETQIYAIIVIYLLVTKDRKNHSRDDVEAMERLLQEIHHSEATRLIDFDKSHSRDEHELALSETVKAFFHGSISCQQFQSSLLSHLRITFPQRSLFREVEEMISSARSISVPNSVNIGISYLMGDLVFGRGVEERNQPGLQDRDAREHLRKILAEALQYFSRGQFSDFLNALTVRYDQRKLLLGIKQVQNGSQCTISLDVRPRVIVSELLNYNFTPAGVANFLVLLGEALLSAPQLKPKGRMSTDVCLVLPKYIDFLKFATMTFDEVLKNTQLVERARDFQRKIKPNMSLAIANNLEEIEKNSSNYSYSVSKDYIEEKLVAPTTIRLEEVKVVARVNYAFAKMIGGGTENLRLSFSLIQSLKEELIKSLEEGRMFPVTEIRLQALADILGVMGLSDDASSHKNDLLFLNINFPAPKDEILNKKIDKVLINNQAVSHCQPVFFPEDGNVDEFALLDQVLMGVLKLDKEKFIRNVCKQYKSNAEPSIALIQQIMRKENCDDVEEWKTEFLKREKSLTFEYLPLLSSMYNLIFLPCVVKPHRDHQRIFVPTEERLDFSNSLAKISVYVLSEEQHSSTDMRPIKGIFVVSDIALNYLHNQLDCSTDQKERVRLINQIAHYHRQQAEKIEKTHSLEALQQWNTAKKYYEQSLKLDGRHATAMLGYARCLIMLSKCKTAQKSLVDDAESNAYFRDSPERWFLLGMVERKLQNYDEAKSAIDNALKLRKYYPEAKHELRLISNLQKETIAERMKLYKKASLTHGEPNSEHYNILSIDGGGIRGLIPAIWLSELERKTQMSTSSMFHMMAGTSTGGIIAAGLSLPEKPGVRRPRYKAVDLVELYSTHARRVFSPSSYFSNFLGRGSKYTEEGRKSICEEYFGDIRLSQAITDLLITSVNSESITTELFRRSDGVTNPSRDYKIVDVLMCTSAAPTYFPPYRLDNCIYVDGGVQANNPAMFAYSDACNRNIDRDQICLLSLGTGDFVPDPLNPNDKRDLLFWFSHRDNVMKIIFDGPQNNISCQLSNLLESDKYHRWQIWLENALELDDIKNESLEYLKELARAHFEEMEASDSSYRFGKLIERLKGY